MEQAINNTKTENLAEVSMKSQATENNNLETENPTESLSKSQSETNNNEDGNHAKASTKDQSSRKRTPKPLRAKSIAIKKSSTSNSLSSKKAKSSPKIQGQNRKKSLLQGNEESRKKEHGSKEPKEREERHGGSAKSSRNEKNKGKLDGKEKNEQDEKKKEKLGGMIFMCSAKTKPDCFRYRVMGVTMNKKELILGVKPGLKLFLYDFDLKLMYGIYEASSSGGVKLEPKAFGGSFPVQVRFAVHKDCYPINESVFKKAIKDNYNEKNKFKTELTVQQVRKLSALFQRVRGPVRSPPIVNVRDRDLYAGARELRVHSDREAVTRANYDARSYPVLSSVRDQRVEYREVGSTHGDETLHDLFMSEKDYRTYGLSGERRKLAPSLHGSSILDPYSRDQEREHLLRQPYPIYRDKVPLQREAVPVDPFYLNQAYNSGGIRELLPATTLTTATTSGSALPALDPYTRDPYYTYHYSASSADAYLPPPRRDEAYSGSYYVDGPRET
ncbi:DCD (DEVELOPMENT AND CELL DEATH) DOMAIN PROTEIN [Salix purpurea]|uniref:DCD (DEVELOPMENT AND CELL DEATH) DOMAIN PROTEIN n=1 Tax=Salix purpurea TaxID=77065 RepID=A0A9Q0W9U8_SALPP|nr:DCD (DEVELOPMENT AND CELL DEATH) DOMAIN PROTEIN [Salix purpurea]